jgi:hypothetical protein
VICRKRWSACNRLDTYNFFQLWIIFLYPPAIFFNIEEDLMIFVISNVLITQNYKHYFAFYRQPNIYFWLGLIKIFFVTNKKHDSMMSYL